MLRLLRLVKLSTVNIMSKFCCGNYWIEFFFLLLFFFFYCFLRRWLLSLVVLRLLRLVKLNTVNIMSKFCVEIIGFFFFFFFFFSRGTSKKIKCNRITQ